MKWEGKKLKSIKQVMEAMEKLQSKEEAQLFLAAAREANPQNADSNVGYLTGYMPAERMDQLLEWFGVKHPVFGAKSVGPAEALRMGIEMGEKARQHG